MSRLVGDRLPDDLLAFLNRTDDARKFHQVILFTTLDDDSWPRYGMLSPWEVVAGDATRLVALLYRSSHASANLRRDGRIVLVVANPEMSYYVYASARPLPPMDSAPDETPFDLAVERVVEDRIPSARLVTALTYEGDDPGKTPAGRAEVFSQLRALATTERENAS